MNEELIATVLERALADDGLSEDAKFLVYAALGGDAELAQALETEHRSALPEAAETLSAAPVRAYLSSVTVEGFRGIGARAVLRLSPGPGLVVVSGRNGSGKSSFAEALEVALTGESYRWKSRPSTLNQRWRNLHVDTAHICVELAEEGRGTTTVGASWPPDASLDHVRNWVQRQGEPRAPGLSGLGWTEQMGPFRPFLSYDELEALLTAGFKLHEALDSILGLRLIDDARARLQRALKQYSAEKETADRIRRGLRPELRSAGEERATLADQLLSKHRPDLTAIAALVTGDVSDDGAGASLRQVSELTLPPLGTYAEALERYRRATTEATAIDTEHEATTVRRLQLLQVALAEHAEHGDSPCPVCGEGRLDAAWAAGVHAEIGIQQQLSARIREAGTALSHAWDAVRALHQPVPHALDRMIVEGVPGAQELVVAWAAWSRLDRDDILEHGLPAFERLTHALPGVVTAAHELAQQRQSVWQPLAVGLGEWLSHAQRARDTDARRRELNDAHEWLKEHADQLRNDRLRPLAKRARDVWALLRQESNVDLGEITLTGQGNRRRVELQAAVDGDEARALEVMSQGELNALALSIFIPKASLPESPFGFIVIDDPVQAMDPSKVDGLARVLAEIAVDRQVVVFTHDDRLAEAVRRLQIDARLVEVTRDAQSVVHVAETLDPARRYLDDARAAARDTDIDADFRTQVVAEMCRMGVESRCRDLYFANRFRAGAARGDVERAWGSARRTRQKVALAVGHTDASLSDWIDSGARAGRDRKLALAVCGSATHQGIRRDPIAAIRAVQNLIDDIGQVRTPVRHGT
jgi:recombinational DNA repair ATPase RecF